MSNNNAMDWQKLLAIAARHLRPSPDSRSWCSWTTFERLGEDAGYWTAALPAEAELLDLGTADGGTWGQPFRYSQIAHLIIPRSFYWEQIGPDGFDSGVHAQDIAGLAEQLKSKGISHRVTDLVLEVKLY